MRSITSDKPQRLLLDRRQIPLLQGRRVVVVDDVIATGASMAAAMRLVRRAGATVLGSELSNHRIAFFGADLYTWRGDQDSADAGAVG